MREPSFGTAVLLGSTALSLTGCRPDQPATATRPAPSATPASTAHATFPDTLHVVDSLGHRAGILRLRPSTEADFAKLPAGPLPARPSDRENHPSTPFLLLLMRLSIRPSLLLLAALGACTEPADQSTKVPATPPAAPVPPPRSTLLTASYAGEYNWGDTTREQAGGTLTVYPESDSTVLFFLDVSNGPPAFHLGQLYQRAVVRQGVGRCAFQADYDPTGCRLRLRFSPQAVVIETEPGYAECGFGNGVSADETYRRRRRAAAPQQFTDGEGRKIRFQSTPPEQYNAAGQ